MQGKFDVPETSWTSVSAERCIVNMRRFLTGELSALFLLVAVFWLSCSESETGGEKTAMDAKSSSVAQRAETAQPVPIQYRLRQIMLEPEVSPEHEARLRARAMECRARIEAGEDFTELAKALSDEPVAVKTSGKLGFFSFEQMVEPFSRAVFAMKPGEIAGPVKTQYGYHIIKLHEIEGDRRNAQHILFALKPDREDTLMTLDTLTRIRKRLLDGEKELDRFPWDMNVRFVLNAVDLDDENWFA